MGYGGVPLGGPGNPITGLSGGVFAPAAAGTPERINATEKGLPCTGIEVQALEDNQAQIAVGGSDVDETRATRKGIVLQPGESRVFYVTNLNMLWFDSANTGDGVGYIVMQ